MDIVALDLLRVIEVKIENNTLIEDPDNIPFTTQKDYISERSTYNDLDGNLAYRVERHINHKDELIWFDIVDLKTNLHYTS